MRRAMLVLVAVVGGALPGCGGCDSAEDEPPSNIGDDGWRTVDGWPPMPRFDLGLWPPREAGPVDAEPPPVGDAEPPPDEDAEPPPQGDAEPPADFGPADDGGDPPVNPPPGRPIPGLSRYLLMDTATVTHLRERFDARSTHPCEIQVVGDSISESFMFLNPLTLDPDRPDMSYEPPAHCRIFGQPSIFLDVPQTAATGMTAGWGLEGDGEFGGVRRVRYPMRYMDRDGGRAPIGERRAWPEVATILFGTNDLRVYVINRMSWDPSPAGEREARRQFLGALRGIVQWALDQGVVPLLITTPPGTYDAWNVTVGDGPPLGPRWVQGIRQLGRDMRVPVFDLNRLYLDQPDWGRLLSDGVHPNRRGYEVINEALYEVYRDLRRHVLVR